MKKAKLYDKQGNATGEVELSDIAFGIEPNKHVLWQYVKAYLANQRVGTHSAKTRAEIRGGGKKPWRQKGTGRARQGTFTSPIWRSGGVAFAPKPRDYRQRFPKKMKKLALASILSDRASDNLIHVIEAFNVEEIKTRSVIDILDNSQINFEKSTLIITGSVKRLLVKSAGNIPGLTVTHAGELNAYQIINTENIIIERNALKKIEELCRR